MARRRKKQKQPNDATGVIPVETPDVNPLGETASPKTISELAERDSKERVAKYHRWIRQSSEVHREFAAAYVESMRLLANDKIGHWTQEALNALGNRPALVINHTTSTVMTVCGLQRRTRQIAQFLPGDPDDADAVELLSYLYRWQYDQLKLKENDSEVFFRKFAGGIGFWKFLYDTSRDPRGKIKVKIPNPLNILWDPNYPDVPWDECMYVMHAEWFTIDEAIDAWPEYENRIRSMTGNWINGSETFFSTDLGDTQNSRRFFWDAETKRVRIVQIYYKRIRPAEVALLGDGNVENDKDKVEALKAEAAEAERAAPSGTDPNDGVVEFVRMPVTTVYQAFLLGEIELAHRVSPVPPLDELPIYPSKGYCFWQRPVGAVEYMKDPQREKNKRRSVITEISGRAAHSGFFDKKGQGAGREQIENFASGAGVRIEYEEVMPERIDPPQLPQYLVYLEQQSTDDIARVVNVTPELQGQPKANVISGRAINQRQQAGQLSQEMFFDSFALDQAEVAKRIIEMIKDHMTPEEARRILGALARRNEDEMAQKIANQGEDELERLLSRAFQAEYDVVVTTEPWDPTGKIAATRAVSDLFSSVPPPPIPALLVGFHTMITELAIESGTLPASVGKRWLTQLQQAQAAMAQQQQQPPGGEVPPGANGGVLPDLMGIGG